MIKNIVLCICYFLLPLALARKPALESCNINSECENDNCVFGVFCAPDYDCTKDGPCRISIPKPFRDRLDAKCVFEDDGVGTCDYYSFCSESMASTVILFNVIHIFLFVANSCKNDEMCSENDHCMGSNTCIQNLCKDFSFNFFSGCSVQNSLCNILNDQCCPGTACAVNPHGGGGYEGWCL